MFWGRIVRSVLEKMNAQTLGQFREEVCQQMAHSKRPDGIHQGQEVLSATASAAYQPGLLGNLEGLFK